MIRIAREAPVSAEIYHLKAAGRDNWGKLDEVITLNSVSIIVAEYIPFGANQIVALNERLGALDRCQGGFFTAIVDTDPTASELTTPPGTTDVKLLDFEFWEIGGSIWRIVFP